MTNFAGLIFRGIVKCLDTGTHVIGGILLGLHSFTSFRCVPYGIAVLSLCVQRKSTGKDKGKKHLFHFEFNF